MLISWASSDFWVFQPVGSIEMMALFPVKGENRAIWLCVTNQGLLGWRKNEPSRWNQVPAGTYDCNISPPVSINPQQTTSSEWAARRTDERWQTWIQMPDKTLIISILFLSQTDTSIYTWCHTRRTFWQRLRHLQEFDSDYMKQKAATKRIRRHTAPTREKINQVRTQEWTRFLDTNVSNVRVFAPLFYLPLI